MKAIILAAGAGRRLGAAVPKCMLDVGGMSIIHRQLAAFLAEGIDEYRRRCRLRAGPCPRTPAPAGRASSPSSSTSEYASTNTVYSLYLASGHLTETCWYANADVVFDRRLVRRLADDSSDAALAVKTHACGEEEVKVVVRRRPRFPHR